VFAACVVVDAMQPTTSTLATIAVKRIFINFGEPEKEGRLPLSASSSSALASTRRDDLTRFELGRCARIHPFELRRERQRDIYKTLRHHPNSYNVKQMTKSY
jgi:hypothetical protein